MPERWPSLAASRPKSPIFITNCVEAEAHALLVRKLGRTLPPPKRFAVLKKARHVHFNDHAEARHEALRAMFAGTRAPASDSSVDFAAIAEASRPFAELCPADHGADTVRGLCLAHMDAHLKHDLEARTFLDGDVARVLAERGIELEVA